jgi:predicted nuclease of predicted toxin-antitoxin system
MKLKLDENLGVRFAERLRLAGHDVATVVDQGLVSATDQRLIGICGAERRCLVTLDLDFANPLRFDPESHAGIAVLRLDRRPTHTALAFAIDTLVRALDRMDITGKLWVVGGARVRSYSGRRSASDPR